MKLSAFRYDRRGPSRFSVCALVKTLCAIVLVSLILSGCKVTSTLTIEVRDGASGSVQLAIELDEKAASAIRRDAYDTATLANVFDAEKLKKVGFKVAIKDNTKGDPSNIDISASFSNEKELKAIFSVLAPPKVLDASLKSNSNFVEEKLNTKITVDLSTLRRFYIEDEDVKSAVEKAGIEFSEFETLVDEAFASTTLIVELNQNGKTPNETIKGDDLDKKVVEASTTSFRASYFFYMVGAIVSGLIGLFLFWRLCRRPRLLSKESTKEQKAGLESMMRYEHELDE